MLTKQPTIMGWYAPATLEESPPRMTPPASHDRRVNDQSDSTKLAVLENEMATVSSDVREIKETLAGVVTLLTDLRIEGAKRTAATERVEATQKEMDSVLTAHIQWEEGTKRGAASQDGLKAWRDKAVNGLVVALCILGIIGTVAYVNSLAKPSVVQAEHVLVGH